MEVYVKEKIMYSLSIENPDKLFFSSDLHFGHFNVCRYCHRPFSSRSEMDNTLIENWNSVVPEDGIVVCCGDFMLPHKGDFKEYKKYLKKLNGTVYLTSGNHDRIENGEYEIDGIKKLIVREKMMIMVDGVEIYVEHYPCTAFNGDFQVFGHIHTLSDGTCYGIDGDVPSRLRKNQYDVGVDQNNYRPISYWELCDVFRNKACEKIK